jgi:tetratricopeptide (TPR) repeat protein
MTNLEKSPSFAWTGRQAIPLAAICLFAGIAGGWTIRAVQKHPATESAQVSAATGNRPEGLGAQAPDPVRLREMADAQAAPLKAQLKTSPDTPELLAGLGNLYYDAHQYLVAVDYYGRALKVNPTDAAVRTDMATAYWYMGNADTAIAEFDKALSYAPTNPNTLFNLGLVKWKGKGDRAGAVADWEKLLAANPGYAGKQQVEEMMAEARRGQSASGK